MSAKIASMMAALERSGASAEPPAAETKTPKGRGGSRVGLKHIGGYLEPDVVEKVALLRARLELDNSQLITRAIELLHAQESARRRFGD